jgi:hypothetical protein
MSACIDVSAVNEGRTLCLSSPFFYNLMIEAKLRSPNPLIIAVRAGNCKDNTHFKLAPDHLFLSINTRLAP